MENLPWYIATTFGFTVLLTIILFAKATHFSKSFIPFLLILILLQSFLGISGFYSDVHTMTSRFPFLVIPLMAFGIALFVTRRGRVFIDSLDIKTLTILHVIRIPVEITLFWLFVHQAIPQAMTFEGRNLDILSGLTAPLVYYFGFVKKLLNRWVIIAWNVVCFLLLINVVSSAVLSLPGRYQQFGFEQPNIAVGYFPFLLLPAILVPLVLFANAAAVRQLLFKNTSLNNPE